MVVVGLRVNDPEPSKEEDQSILLAVKLRLPIPVTAPVIEIAPVPALTVKFLAPPEIARAIVTLELLVLLSKVRCE